ncbi:hypothetical protein DFP73DRAFT_534654 [Morchella snyderi]|nr:hypothetical protein DFP73DRAFT_534654 [Morchella snyderi]
MHAHAGLLLLLLTHASWERRETVPSGNYSESITRHAAVVHNNSFLYSFFPFVFSHCLFFAPGLFITRSRRSQFHRTILRTWMGVYLCS